MHSLLSWFGQAKAHIADPDGLPASCVIRSPPPMVVINDHPLISTQPSDILACIFMMLHDYLFI